MTKYYIRYNVDHKSGVSDKVWKVFESETKFWLTDKVTIKVPSWTGTSELNGSTKYSIWCEGRMSVCTELEIVIEI